MTNPEFRPNVAERLEDLYQRHRSVNHEELESYYDSSRGYYSDEEAGEERDRFSVCLATVEGGLYVTGDHDWPFALQSISKVFAYGLALSDHTREDVLARVGVE